MGGPHPSATSEREGEGGESAGPRPRKGRGAQRFWAKKAEREKGERESFFLFIFFQTIFFQTLFKMKLNSNSFVQKKPLIT